MIKVTNNVKEAAKAVKKGKIVAFPTDTVFGLGTNAFNRESVLKIFKIKKRSLKKPLIINVSSLSMIKEMVVVDKNIKKLAEKFWPGKVTFIFKKKKRILDAVTSGRNTLAVRIPDCKVTLNLIKIAKCPIVSTSANFEGEKEPLNSFDINPNLVKCIDIVLERSNIKVSGRASTIIDVSCGFPRIIRHGDPIIDRKLNEYMVKFIYSAVKSKRGKNGEDKKRN